MESAMESSRMAFLLARFAGLMVWVNGVFEATYVLDRLSALGAYRSAGAQHYYGGLLMLMLFRVALYAMTGALLWLNADRVGRWLESGQDGDTQGAPPLSLP